MNLTNSQNKAVDDIFKLYLEKKKEIYFKAPTGSGKTFIASTLISKILANELNKEEKTIIIIATISNADLPKQFSNKLNEYKKYHNFKLYDIEHVESPSNSRSNKMEDYRGIHIKNNKVFVLGTSSFGKNTIFHQQKVLNNLIDEIQNNNYNMIYIRDEAHIGSKKRISKDELKKVDQKLEEAATFTLKMTATPPSLHQNFIEITEDKLKEDHPKYLLKTPPSKQPYFLEDEVSDEYVLNQAIKQFKKSKNEYNLLNNVVINPAMLIQVSNNSSTNKEIKIKYEETLFMIEEKLKHAGLTYLKYLDNEKKIIGTQAPATLKYASKIDSIIDVIIFKVGPATGWDIPRANMLVQLRNVCSEGLNIQTLGRIKRNPYPGLKFNTITDKYYLYSNYQPKTRQMIRYELKPEFKNKLLYKGKIDKYNKNIDKCWSVYRNKVIRFINSNEFLDQFKNIDLDKDIIEESYSINKSDNNQKIKNAIFLKIFNYNQYDLYDENYRFYYFDAELIKIKNNLKKWSLDIVKYKFIKNIEEIKKIKAKSNEWNNEDAFEIFDDAILMPKYDIWKDNNNFKKISNLDKYRQYGYIQLNKDVKEQYTQYLDSNPERIFIKRFIGHKTVQSNIDDITFFAKMPTLGSSVYFEYYSKIKGGFTRSYIDFTIEYKDRVIMVEIKSKDNDYDYDKTEELKEAYKIYMNKKTDKKLILSICKVDKNETLIFNYMKDGNWVSRNFLDEALEYFFN